MDATFCFVSLMTSLEPSAVLCLKPFGSPYTRRSRTRPETRLDTACRPPRPARAPCRSYTLRRDSSGSTASPLLQRAGHGLKCTHKTTGETSVDAYKHAQIDSIQKKSSSVKIKTKDFMGIIYMGGL